MTSDKVDDKSATVESPNSNEQRQQRQQVARSTLSFADEPPSIDYGYGDTSESLVGISNNSNDNNNNSQRRRNLARRVNAVTAEKHHNNNNNNNSFEPRRVLLYSEIRQRQKWNQAQSLPRINWGDLFFDLFYVAATYNVSYILYDRPDKMGLLYSAGTFLPIMNIWQTRTVLDSRYVTESDVFHKLSFLCLLVILGIAVLHIRTVDTLRDVDHSSSTMVFCLMLVLERLLVVVQCAEIYRYGIGQAPLKQASIRDALLAAYGLVFYLAAFLYAAVRFSNSSPHHDNDHRRLATLEEYDEPSESSDIPIYLTLFGFIFYNVVFTIQVACCFPSGGKHKEIAIPINIDFMIHRNGEWMMLMLGESIFSLLVVHVEQEGSDFYSVFYFGILTMVCLQWLHFQSQPHTACQHASRRSKNAGLAWAQLQYVYSLALVTLGAAFTFFLIHTDKGVDDTTNGRFLAGSNSDKDSEKAAAHLFSGALAIVFASLDVMTLLHLGMEESKKRFVAGQSGRTNYLGMILIALRVALVAFTATLSQWQTDPTGVCFFGFLSVVGQLALRKLGSLFLGRSKESNHSTEPHPSKGMPKSDSATGEAGWPNVTHARAEPASKDAASTNEQEAH